MPAGPPGDHTRASVALAGGIVTAAPRYYRKVIRIRAEDSPNVRLGLAQEAAGIVPTDEVVVEGILTYGEFKARRAKWSKQEQCEGLDAEWSKGAQVMLFPPEWLALAEDRARKRGGVLGRGRRCLGIDAAEGGDNTAWVVGEEAGLLAMVQKKTGDTSVITGDTIALMREYGVDAHDVLFDRGGGGKQHADVLRRQGYPVRTVAFGEAVAPMPKHGKTTISQRREQREKKYPWKNRRVQMYYEFSALLDPAYNPAGFAVPSEMLDRPRQDGLATLRRQLAVFPRRTDAEGRFVLPPKNRRTPDGDEECLVRMIGCSPDEADAAVLCVHGLLHPERPRRAGVA